MNSNVKIVLLDCTVTFLHKTFGLAFNKRTSQNIYVQRQRVLSLWVKTIHITDWDVNIWSSNIVDINLLQQWLWTQALRSRLQVDRLLWQRRESRHPSHPPSDDSAPALSLSFKQLVIFNQSKNQKTRLLRNINMQKKTATQNNQTKRKIFSVTHIQTPHPNWKQQPSEEHRWQEGKYSVTYHCRINHCVFSRRVSIEVD